MKKMSAEGNAKKYEIDMCNGPLLGKILIFYLPLMLSGILQLLFNAADIVVVGRFAGNEALAAVGSTSSLTNLLVNLFIGLSVGANVLVARFYGGGKSNELKEMVQTAIATSVIGGILLIFVGFFASKPALALMGTPEDVIAHSVLYMRIYFMGMPFMMAYNFGAAAHWKPLCKKGLKLSLHSSRNPPLATGKNSAASLVINRFALCKTLMTGFQSPRYPHGTGRHCPTGFRQSPPAPH